jgi:hypothetical protein
MASERIIDTLEFFPRNSPMPQISSTDRLIMAANDMTDALKHPHLDVPFATIGDDTITALSQLETIFKNKFQKPSAPELRQAPLKAAENKQPSALTQPILTSPMKKNYQTRSQHQASPTYPANVIESQNSPLLPRVVTPAVRIASPPRVPARANNLSPRNLPQDDFLDMGSVNQAIALVTNHWTNIKMENAVVHPFTGKEMEYTAIMKDPTLNTLWKRGFGNEAGRLFQGICDIQGTKTCFFVELKKTPKDAQITYGKKLCDYKPHKEEKERVRLTVGGDTFDYSGGVVTSTADITTFKNLINSTLSTKDTEMKLMDIKKYYLGTPLPRYEYMRMLLSIFPKEIINKYNLRALALYGWVYIEIRKGMYGLKC